MTAQHQAYISLGSNKGDAFKNLQLAIDAIDQKIGFVKSISRVYKTKSWGFEADDFNNACILIETHLSAKKLLKALLEIERNMGRQRSNTEGYQSRIIDRDILFFNDEIIELPNLIVPHPQLHKRKFVLVPLMDVSSQLYHPVFEKKVDTLLNECEDKLEVEPINIWLKNPSKQYRFKDYNYIAIEGNIGAGKTSLATIISHEFNAKLILERFADNPFLPKFYKEPKRYAFTLEMSFLADRYQQISDDLSQLDLFKDFIVSDYDVFKSLIFSKITLPEDEFALYRKLFYQVYKDIAKPDLYIYLYQNTERLQANIKKRGRNYEQNIADDYLEKINAGYLEFLKNHSDFNVKIIDISEKDFVKNREDYVWVLEQIHT